MAFWKGVKARAKEILQRDVEPGIDYALTEVVHCKSSKEIGVKKARRHCSELYLNSILELSSSRIVIVLGVEAKESMIDLFPKISPSEGLFVGPIEFLGRDRIIVFSPHPNARTVRMFKKILSAEELALLRSFVAEV